MKGCDPIPVKTPGHSRSMLGLNVCYRGSDKRVQKMVRDVQNVQRCDRGEHKSEWETGMVEASVMMNA